MIEIKNPMERNIFFSGGVESESMKIISEKIITINDDDKMMKKVYALHNLKYKPKPIKIFIDSPGGLVYDAFGTISIIEKSKTPVYTYCTGKAMSCGFMLLIAGHKRFCYEHGTVLYHQIAIGASGKIKDAEERLVEGNRLQKNIEELTLRKTNISKKQLKKNYKEKIDWYITPQEALKLKIVDKII